MEIGEPAVKQVICGSQPRILPFGAPVRYQKSAQAKRGNSFHASAWHRRRFLLNQLLGLLQEFY
jgi:hypothetical protein